MGPPSLLSSVLNLWSGQVWHGVSPILFASRTGLAWRRTSALPLHEKFCVPGSAGSPVPYTFLHPILLAIHHQLWFDHGPCVAWRVHSCTIRRDRHVRSIQRSCTLPKCQARAVVEKLPILPRHRSHRTLLLHKKQNRRPALHEHRPAINLRLDQLHCPCPCHDDITGHIKRGGVTSLHSGASQIELRDGRTTVTLDVP